MKKILVIGSINYDLSVSVNRFPLVGETIKGNSFLTNCGGKGANQAVACSKLGGKVMLCSAVGKDLFGEESISSLNKFGVDTSFVKKVDGPTGTAVIVVGDKDNFIVINQGANGEINPKQIDEFLTQNLNSGDIVVLQNEILKESLSFALQKARDLGGYIIVNPSPVDNLTIKDFSMVDLLVVNETEAEILSGVSCKEIQNVSNAEKVFLQNGIKDVVITLGEKGCYYKGQIYPSIKNIKVIDTTAAGDTFLGALAVSISQNKKIEESIDFCQKAASITISRRGAQESIPYIKEISL